MKNRIKELRARYNLRQEDLADKVEVTRQTILAIETGKYAPSLELAFKIARVLKSTVEEVFLYDSKR